MQRRRRRPAGAAPTDACAAFGISTPKRVAAFLTQVGHESASLSRIVENPNYGAQGMADTWLQPLRR